MFKIDLVLLHPPAIYDFREEPILHGPVSDLIPSTPIFEFYPIGFVSLSEYLERHNCKVRIINIALKMLKSSKFDVEKAIKSLQPVAFGIDLHWMPHVQGSLAIAEIIKKYHPDIPVIFGGLSSTYFHKDLIDNYPAIDFVVRGDSTENPMLRLIEAIKNKKQPENIPNVTWRNKQGKTIINPLDYVPKDLNNIAIDYSHIIKKVIRHRDIFGYMPYEGWLDYPAAAVFSVRGCIHQCKTCGGSAFAFKNMANRTKPAYRDPKLIVRDIINIQNILNGPIIIIGDLLQKGQGYADEIFQLLKKEKITSEIAVEFFMPPSRELLEKIADAIPKFNIEISIESHDEKVRRAFGRPYGNESFEKMVLDAFELGCRRLDIFFMTGLPEQTCQSIQETAEYCRKLFNLVRPENRKDLFPFISPLAPFVDPGSAVFENPEKHGYKLFCKTVAEHREILTMPPSWKYILNYETKWMTRDEIVYGTYEAAMKLNRIKAEVGVIDYALAEKTEERAKKAVEMMHQIDKIVEKHNGDKLKIREELFRLKSKIDTLSTSTVCEKSELEWPTKIIKMNPFKIIKSLFTKQNNYYTEN